MRSPGSISIVCRRRTGELVVRERPVVEQAERPRKLALHPRHRHRRRVAQDGLARRCAGRPKLYEEDMIAEEEARPQRPRGRRAPASLSMLALSMVALATQEDGEPTRRGAPEEKRSPLLTILPILFAVGLFVALPQARRRGAQQALQPRARGAARPASRRSPARSSSRSSSATSSLIRRFARHPPRVSVPRRRAQDDLHLRGAARSSPSTTRARRPRCIRAAARRSSSWWRSSRSSCSPASARSCRRSTGSARSSRTSSSSSMKLPFLPLIAALTFEIQRVFARYCTTGPAPRAALAGLPRAEDHDHRARRHAARGRARLAARHALPRGGASRRPRATIASFASYGELVADRGYAGCEDDASRARLRPQRR